jgi:hypothetical protein
MTPPAHRTDAIAYTLVERELETKSELEALIVDYLQHAIKRDSPPLAVSPLEKDLEADT